MKILIKATALISLVFMSSSMTATAAYQPCNIGIITETTPTSRFQDNGDNTVTDLKTNLIWKKCSEGQYWNNPENTCNDDQNIRGMYNWQEALENVQALNAGSGFAGAVNWRLPNIKELSSIIEGACYGPAINLSVFPGTPAGIYWSSTPYTGADPYAWAVRFNYGQSSANLKHDYYFMRLVRDGAQ